MSSYREMVRLGRRDCLIVKSYNGWRLASASKNRMDIALFGPIFNSQKEAAEWALLHRFGTATEWVKPEVKEEAVKERPTKKQEVVVKTPEPVKEVKTVLPPKVKDETVKTPEPVKDETVKTHEVDTVQKEVKTPTLAVFKASLWDLTMPLLRAKWPEGEPKPKGFSRLTKAELIAKLEAVLKAAA